MIFLKSVMLQKYFFFVFCTSPNQIEMLSALKRIFNDLFSLFFPKLCLGCEEALLLTKQCICYRCEIALPPTYFHLVNENPMDDRIATSPQLKKLFSLYYFESSGTIERMLYALKYQGNKTVGVFFGRKLAATIAANSMHFDGIVGVPLHLKKRENEATIKWILLVKLLLRY